MRMSLDLPDKAIPVKDCYKEVEAARDRDRLGPVQCLQPEQALRQPSLA